MEFGIYKEPLLLTTHDLARWIRSFDSVAVPPKAMHKAALLVLDSIGVAFAATAEQNAAAVIEVLAKEGGEPQCQVIGTGFRLPASKAVLVNGALIRALDYNDFMGGGSLGGHPSDNIAVALAIGEWRNLCGREMLATIVMAYELYGRLQELIERDQGWDHVSATGLVAPAIAGQLMRLPEDQLAHALAIGAAHCPTLGAIRTGHISSSKVLANAIVAGTGTMAALFAASGLTGPVHALEGSKGLAGTVLAPPIRKLVAPCDSRLRILDAAVKAYPCIGTCQTAVAAALELRRGWPLPSRIDRIEVRMADTPAVRSQVEDEDRRHPASREAADHSFYFLIAAALADGELTQAQFANERWMDPNLRPLMERISIRLDPHLTRSVPDGFPCAIRLVTRGGEERLAEVSYPPGHPTGEALDAIVIEKFERCTRERLSPSHRAAIIRAVLSLEEGRSVSDLMRTATDDPISTASEAGRPE